MTSVRRLAGSMRLAMSRATRALKRRGQSISGSAMLGLTNAHASTILARLAAAGPLCRTSTG